MSDFGASSVLEVLPKTDEVPKRFFTGNNVAPVLDVNGTGMGSSGCFFLI